MFDSSEFPWVFHLKEGGLTLRDLATGVKAVDFLLLNVLSSIIIGERSPQRRLESSELHTMHHVSNFALGTYMISPRVFDMSSVRHSVLLGERRSLRTGGRSNKGTWKTRLMRLEPSQCELRGRF